MLAPWKVAMPWYHNTDAELNPGDELLPASKRGVPSRWDAESGYDPNLVYFTQGPQRLPPDHHDSPFGKHTYEVEPVGDIQRDPEWESNKKSYGSDYEYEDEIPGAQDYAAPGARVVRKYHPDNWKHAAVPGYQVHLHDTNGYGSGVAGIHPEGQVPTGANWHSAIAWDNHGKITNLDTKEQHRGKGLGRALVEHVRNTWRPDLMHDRSLTDEGRGFAEAVGGQQYDAEEYQRRRDQADIERKLPWEERQQLMKDRGWPQTAGIH